MVGPKKQDFWPRINILGGKNLKNLSWWMSAGQKLGMILENKVVQKLFFTKNGLLNWYS